MWNSENYSDPSGFEQEPGVLRQLVESAILLAVAVILFRAFAAEGYLISTGSMAPSLLGYHRQVTCPSCQFHFARGAAFDSDASIGEIAHASNESDAEGSVFVSQHLIPSVSSSTCPNCGLSDIDSSHSPRNEGDQLLVHKHAFQFRDPRRWEVIVFRNPGDQRQAYVKRTIGLPGEHLTILDGDVYANGELQRKPYEVQRAIRIPVADYKHQPDADDPDWRVRWKPLRKKTSWSLEADQLTFDATDRSSKKTDWVEYQHWIRAGGAHECSASLAQWPEQLSKPNPRYSNLRYENGTLICRGALTDLERRKWIYKTDDPQFHAAINQIFERSHVAPIVDLYGYNMAGHASENSVHDLMVSASLKNVTGEGRFELRLSDGANNFRVVFDFADNVVELLLNGDSVPLRTANFDADWFEEETIDIDFSLFDAQAIVAVNEKPLFSPYTYEFTSARKPLTNPLRVGVSKLRGELVELQLYRDVYYTAKAKPDEEPQQEFDLTNDQFFVLGDNSPVSVDSRVWEDPAVPRDALIGKPFVVHLPSQQGQYKWRGEVKYVRIPDFSRVRVIR